MTSSKSDRPADSAPAKQPSRLGRVLRWAAIIAGAPIAVLVVALLALAGLGITIDFSGQRERIERVASGALDRKVTVDGPIRLIPGLSPTLQVEDIHVGNPSGWPEADFARLGLARAQLGIPALLRGEVEIEEITVAGLSIAMERNAAGEPNWPVRAQQAAPADSPSTPDENTLPTALRFIELRELTLTDIAVTFHDAASGKDYELKLNEITGDAVDREPMNLFVQGAVQKVPYAMTLTTDSLASLFAGKEPWQLDVSAAAVDSNLTISGEIAQPLLGKGLALDVALKGPELAELETLLNRELPQIRSFDLRGRIVEAEGAYGLSDLQGTLGGHGLRRLAGGRHGGRPAPAQRHHRGAAD